MRCKQRHWDVNLCLYLIVFVHISLKDNEIWTKTMSYKQRQCDVNKDNEM